MCGHTERVNRHKKRFNCRSCSHQDHGDRGAGVDVAVKVRTSGTDPSFRRSDRPERYRSRRAHDRAEDRLVTTPQATSTPNANHISNNIICIIPSRIVRADRRVGRGLASADDCSDLDW